jgi:hypothetical protein
MRKNGKSTKQVNKAAKGKAKPAAPKSAAKKTAAPEKTTPLGRRGQIREVANVKVFQRKLDSVQSLLKTLGLKKITRLSDAGADRLAPRGPRAGLPSRQALVETVLSTATPAKPIRPRDLAELLTPLGVAALGPAIRSLQEKHLITTDGKGAYWAVRNGRKGTSSKN